jgi:hypothetical protein
MEQIGVFGKRRGLVRNLICISLLLYPVAALPDDTLCLRLDTSSEWLSLDPDSRSIEAMSVGIAIQSEDTAKMRISASFTGPSIEAPQAVSNVIYDETYACRRGPEDSWSGDWPEWVQDGGWLCARHDTPDEFQLVEVDGKYSLWTPGAVLSSAFGDAPATMLTARGRASAGYELFVSDNPFWCGT